MRCAGPGCSTGPFGPRYMNLRRRTEARRHEMFVAAGGRPERRWPHYCVLGDSPWYAGLAEDMQRIQLPVSALPPGQVTFTYPDSFTAMGLGTSLGLGPPPRPCHGRVYLPGELPGLIEQIGMPDPSGCAAGTRRGRPGPRRPISRSSSGAMSPSGITCPVSAMAARIPGMRHDRMLLERCADACFKARVACSSGRSQRNGERGRRPSILPAGGSSFLPAATPRAADG